ncbi:MAG: hypothetical protein JWM14_1331 [Chitinophagaceae bacterium]|nr:hypothetical protein [Chitinophagaceae bacterium]
MDTFLSIFAIIYNQNGYLKVKGKKSEIVTPKLIRWIYSPITLRLKTWALPPDFLTKAEQDF